MFSYLQASIRTKRTIAEYTNMECKTHVPDDRKGY